MIWNVDFLLYQVKCFMQRIRIDRTRGRNIEVKPDFRQSLKVKTIHFLSSRLAFNVQHLVVRKDQKSRNDNSFQVFFLFIILFFLRFLCDNNLRLIIIMYILLSAAFPVKQVLIIQISFDSLKTTKTDCAPNIWLSRLAHRFDGMKKEYFSETNKLPDT